MFGHVSRFFWFCKDDSAGHSERLKMDRRKKRWEDNIKEWARMDLSSSNRAAEKRIRWKRIVVRSSVVPRRPCNVMGSNRID